MGTVAFEIDGLAGVDNDLTGQRDRTIIIVVIMWLHGVTRRTNGVKMQGGEGL